MNAKNTKKSLIHENADANITCDFGDGDISRSRSRLPHTRTHGHTISSIIVRFHIRRYHPQTYCQLRMSLSTYMEPEAVDKLA